MSGTASDDVERRLHDAIEAVYRQFAAPTPAVIEGCPCCVGTRNVDILLTTPLREISVDTLWPYTSGVYYTIGDDRDFRYLLPRILELSVRHPVAANDPEVVLNKLRLARWQSWSAEDQRVVRAVIDAWFDRAILRDGAEEPDAWALDSESERVLCGIAHAGLPLTPFLQRLTEPAAARVLDDIRTHAPQQLSSFWDDVPDDLKALLAIL